MLVRDNMELRVEGEVAVEEGWCRKTLLDFFLSIYEDTNLDGFWPGMILYLTNFYTSEGDTQGVLARNI